MNTILNGDVVSILLSPFELFLYMSDVKLSLERTDPIDEKFAVQVIDFVLQNNGQEIVSLKTKRLFIPVVGFYQN
jgi:hypothetical protein